MDDACLDLHVPKVHHCQVRRAASGSARALPEYLAGPRDPRAPPLQVLGKWSRCSHGARCSEGPARGAFSAFKAIEKAHLETLFARLFKAVKGLSRL